MVEKTSTRVVVAVDPPLLADLLSRVMARPGLDVVLYRKLVSRPHSPRDLRFDVALVSGPLPPDLHADVVISLPNDAGRGGACILRTRQGDDAVQDVVQIEKLADLVQLLDRFSPSASSPRPPA
ncbi:MAG: hypothetical protein ACE5KX_07735 [Acidimicrobiia bacterium]